MCVCIHVLIYMNPLRTQGSIAPLLCFPPRNRNNAGPSWPAGKIGAGRWPCYEAGRCPAENEHTLFGGTQQWFSL